MGAGVQAGHRGVSGVAGRDGPSTSGGQGGLIPGQPEAGWLADGPCPCSVGRMDTSSHLEVVWLDEPCADPQQHPASMSSPCLLAQRPPADMPSCRHARGQGTAQRQE